MSNRSDPEFWHDLDTPDFDLKKVQWLEACREIVYRDVPPLFKSERMLLSEAEARGLEIVERLGSSERKDAGDHWVPFVIARVPRPISEEVWTYLPYGDRLVVRRQPPDEKWGGEGGKIVIPENYVRANACGWVLTVGEGICIPQPPRGRRCPYEHPIDFVGRKVAFGWRSGISLAFTGGDDKIDIEAEYVELSIEDIHAEYVEQDPPSEPIVVAPNQIRSI